MLDLREATGAETTGKSGDWRPKIKFHTSDAIWAEEFSAFVDLP
jgi:hypothetical protein